MMMLGREIGLPAELMFGSPGNTGQPEGDQYVGELQTAIEGAHRVARETRHQCTIASLYLSVRRGTVRGRSRFMYVK
jgi:hypothetical protein